MLRSRKQKKRIRKALKDVHLQTALEKASSQHEHKFQKTKSTLPWEELKDRARLIKADCVSRLPELIQQFTEAAESAGAKVHRAATPDEACALIDGILKTHKAKFIVKSKSMVSEEIGLNAFLEERDYQIVETDLGEWIVQLAGERPSHITAPALHKTKEEVAELFSEKLGRHVPPDIPELVKIAREEMRKSFINAEAGISGANLAIAETGTLVILSNEGNARLVTSLPPLHIALVTTEKFVESLEQASVLIKALATASSGLPITAYVSLITGPSRTTDIEKEMVMGAHGPQEVHIVILDNGRLAIARNDDYRESLYCLKCGGCMLICPVFQAVGGYNFGGPVYPGGIGIMLTAITESLDDAYPWLNLCADCKKCEAFCPVRIPTADLLLKLKSLEGPWPWDKALSFFLRKKSLFESAVRIGKTVQRAWQKNGRFKRLPFSWAKGKSIPVFNDAEQKVRASDQGDTVRSRSPHWGKEIRRVYLFQGCMVKYFFPEIRESAIKVLSRFGLEVIVPRDQTCCGAPSYHLGDTKGVRELAQANLASFDKEAPDLILTVCPTGNGILKNLYPQIQERASQWADKIFDFSEFIAGSGFLSKTATISIEERLFYHYPCHYSAESKLKGDPVKNLKSLGYVPEVEGGSGTCCGFCGVFSFRNPEISAHFWKKKERKVQEHGARLIATDCPGCIFQFRANLRNDGLIKIYHTAELIAQKLETLDQGSGSSTLQTKRSGK